MLADADRAQRASLQAKLLKQQEFIPDIYEYSTELLFYVFFPVIVIVKGKESAATGDPRRGAPYRAPDVNT